MRTFIAVELPQEVKNELAVLQAKLKECGAPVSWVKPDNIHATLKFLGEVPEQRLEAVYQAVEMAMATCAKCSMKLEGIGGFPNVDRPRVLWVGVGAGKTELAELARRVEEALFEAGFPKETRAFSAHFTLGRIKEPRHYPVLSQMMRDVAFSSASIPIDRVLVMKSELRPHGAIYTPVREVILL